MAVNSQCFYVQLKVQFQVLKYILTGGSRTITATIRITDKMQGNGKYLLYIEFLFIPEGVTISLVDPVLLIPELLDLLCHLLIQVQGESLSFPYIVQLM